MGFLEVQCYSVKTNHMEPPTPPLPVLLYEIHNGQTKGVSFLGQIFLSESVDKNITVAFVHLNCSLPFAQKTLHLSSWSWKRRNGSPEYVLKFSPWTGFGSHHGQICNMRLSGLQGCQQNNITPLWRSDRPYKECGLLYLLMLVTNFVKDSLNIFPQNVC